MGGGGGGGLYVGLGRDSRVQSRAIGTSRERSGEEGVRSRYARGVTTLRLPLASLAEFFRPRWEPVGRLL